MNQEHLELKNLFSSSDLALVTTLSLWVSIETIERHPDSKAIFYFKRDAELEKLLELYWKRELLVEPQAYFTQLKAVKTRIYGTY